MRPTRCRDDGAAAELHDQLGRHLRADGELAAAGAFTAVRHDDVAGVPVTEYDATIPQAAVQAGLPPQFRDVMKKDVTGDSQLRLWLDALGPAGQGGHVRQLRPQGGPGDRHLLRLGPGPEVTAPPAMTSSSASPDPAGAAGSRWAGRVNGRGLRQSPVTEGEPGLALVPASAPDGRIRPVARHRHGQSRAQGSTTCVAVPSSTFTTAVRSPPGRLLRRVRRLRQRRRLGLGRRQQAEPELGPEVVNALSIIERASSSTSSLKSAHISSTSELGGKSTTIERRRPLPPDRAEPHRLGRGAEPARGAGRQDVLPQAPGRGRCPGRKPWMSMSLTQMAKLTGLDLDSLLNNATRTRPSSCCRPRGPEVRRSGDRRRRQHPAPARHGRRQKALDALTTKGATAQKSAQLDREVPGHEGHPHRPLGQRPERPGQDARDLHQQARRRRRRRCTSPRSTRRSASRPRPHRRCSPSPASDAVVTAASDAGAVVTARAVPAYPAF